MAIRQRTRSQVGYGIDNALQNLAPQPIVANRAPTTSDTAPLGAIWVYSAANEAWVLVNNANASATWEPISQGGSGTFTSLTVNPGPVTTQGTGAVNISADAVATTVNVGTGAGVKTVALGSSNTTSTTTINGGSGSGAVLIQTNTGNIDIIGGAGSTISISDDATAGTLDLGTGAAAKTVVLGSTNTSSSVTINAGSTTGSIALAAVGAITISPVTATAASPTASVTANLNLIKATFTGFTTANAGGLQTYTINSSKILTSSACLVNVTNLNASTNGAFLTIQGIIQAAGSLAIHTQNNGAGALGAGDSVIITVFVLS